MTKSFKHESKSAAPSINPGCTDDPGKDDPHDAVDLELLAIALSLARVREIIHNSPNSATLRGSVGYRKPPLKKSRRKAATLTIQNSGAALRSSRGQIFRQHAPVMTS